MNSKATQTGVLSLDLAVRVTEAGESGAAAAKALNLEPLFWPAAAPRQGVTHADM